MALFRFRNIATAFLLHEDKVLMIKRSEDKEIGAGKWFGVGGHIEPSEINNPYAAALREVNEETGLKSENIEDFDLKYIVYNHVKGEIVVNHIFFGRPDTYDVVANNEGTLHWVPRSEAIERLELHALKRVLAHYFSEVREEIMLGVVDCEDPYIWWYPL